MLVHGGYLKIVTHPHQISNSVLNKSMYRSKLILSMLVVVLFALPTLAKAETLAIKTPYIVIDIKTGEILAQQKANDRWYPASLTKLMTAYVTFKAIQRNEIEAGSPVVISAAAQKQPPSKMGYKKGVKLRIDTALKIIIIKSANDVSHALGEAVAGNLKAFVVRMNQEAKRLGMSNTQFTNSNGLHNANQYSSARDMALLSAQILKEFPQYAYMYEAAAIKTPSKTHYSYNLLLERFKGANGMKTGFVCASGYNLVGSATRNERSLVAVLMGTSSQTQRAVSAAHLLDAGFKTHPSNQATIYNTNPIKGAKPKNMRPILCTQEARNSRYDPGAGKAKIKSTHLYARRISSKILSITTGGITATASAASYINIGKIPVPTKRPKTQLNVGNIVFKTIGSAATGEIPLPTKRP